MKKTPIQKQHIHNIPLDVTLIQEGYNLLKEQTQPTNKVMVAVSGGSDSILASSLLYNFFVKQKYNLQNLFFVHCNHTTRKGNKEDELFVRQFFTWTQLIVAKRTTTKKHTEAELRKRRYETFKKHAKQHWITTIVFWHNLTDRIESTFLNLLRGANINGLIAIQKQEDHHLLSWIQVLRPIIWITKNEVLDLCKKNKIPFITDPTNKDNSTSLRNKLRNKILPELYKLTNKQTKTTNSFIESMKHIYTTLEKKQEKILNSELWTLYSIKKSPHRKATFAYQRKIDSDKITNENMMQIMKKLHSSNNVTTPLLKELTNFLNKNESGYKYVNNTYFFKSHGNIYIISAPKEFRKKTIDSEKKIDNLTTKRFPRKGDKYKGKTWNEWCINQKIPIFRRNFIPILVTKENKIIQIFNEKWIMKNE